MQRVVNTLIDSPHFSSYDDAMTQPNDPTMTTNDTEDTEQPAAFACPACGVVLEVETEDVSEQDGEMADGEME